MQFSLWTAVNGSWRFCYVVYVFFYFLFISFLISLNHAPFSNMLFNLYESMYNIRDLFAFSSFIASWSNRTHRVSGVCVCPRMWSILEKFACRDGEVQQNVYFGVRIKSSVAI